MANLILAQDVQALIDGWLKAESEGVKFPVPLELGWQVAGYATKASAKRALDKFLVDGEDYLFNNVLKSSGGRASEDFRLTCDSLKELCMLSKSETGKATRKYFIDTEKKWRLVQQIAPEVAQEVELQKLRNEGIRLELQKSQADLQLIQFRHIVTTTLPEPIQQKILGYQVVEKIEYRQPIVYDGQIVNDGSTILKGELCRRYGILTRNGKPDYPRLNKILEQLPSDAFQLSVRPQENYELLRSHLPVLDKLMLDSTRQAWIGEGINS